MVKKGKMETTETKETLKGAEQEAVPDGRAPAGESGSEDLQSRIREAEEKAAEHYEKYVRALAELENAKKRAVRDKADAIQYGNERLLKDLLPLVDSLDRALEQACHSSDFESFKRGLQLLREQMLGCLQKHGVELIETSGKTFDPNVHEALMQVDSQDHRDRDVVGEFEKGYLLNGRLLRPAKVSVCKGLRNAEDQDCRETAQDG